MIDNDLLFLILIVAVLAAGAVPAIWEAMRDTYEDEDWRDEL